jgi:hypothetical protein
MQMALHTNTTSQNFVYYQIAQAAFAAIARKKQINGDSWALNTGLINSLNTDRKDLYDSLSYDIT